MHSPPRSIAAISIVFDICFPCWTIQILPALIAIFRKLSEGPQCISQSPYAVGPHLPYENFLVFNQHCLVSISLYARLWFAYAYIPDVKMSSDDKTADHRCTARAQNLPCRTYLTGLCHTSELPRVTQLSATCCLISKIDRLLPAGTRPSNGNFTTGRVARRHRTLGLPAGRILTTRINLLDRRRLYTNQSYEAHLADPGYIMNADLRNSDP
jgi:hypothetical protein